ncbi:hypothetical protein AUK45_01265 [Candidatus Peregrinibacteria bacterium CG2_30_44_17]|nr:MAG: hypothetical protein AUK45_01265 [Candidatus Peregrinibacteria bacterium CG2_30_44_17]
MIEVTSKLTTPDDTKLDILSRVLDDDEVLSRIGELTGIWTIRSAELKLLNPGRRFKVIYLLEISDGYKNGKVVIKFHRRNLPRRFEREVSPRTLPSIEPFAPGFIASRESVSHTDKNHPFQRDDYRLFIEEYIVGRDLEAIYEDESPLKYISAGIAEARYERLGAITSTMGWVLSNVHPGNIRFRAYDNRDATIVDLGEQDHNAWLDQYTEVVRRNIFGPLLRNQS